MSSLSTLSGHPHFKKIQSFRTDYSSADISHYVSTRSCLTVVVVDRKGPIVRGQFALASEIHDDSGAPHTLEHLCFMGSKSYPFAGTLDKIATRAYSNTNAYTATSHTVYSLDTAGWKGFAQILPIYLEHIIVPLLTDSSCYTEVHHIDGEGNDAGVVYSEMQARENNADMLMFTKSKQLLYPEGVGFRYDTFGMMESLRTLTAERIRRYHQETYQPKNLCVTIVGEVDHASLLSTLDEFEDTIMNQIPKLDAPFQRPWVGSKQELSLQESVLEVVEFPEEDESCGQISMSFFGPPYIDHLLCSAMTVLLAYLAGSPASVLENTLVEKEELASAVIYEHDIQPTAVVHFTLSSVATEKLNAVEARFFEVLKETEAKPIDLGYMHDCIKREKRQRKFEAETSGDYFAEPIVNDFLFGERSGSTLRAELESLKDYDVLESWTELQWRHWLKTWFSHAPHVTIIGRPSARLSEKLILDEKARIEKRKAKMGSAELESQKQRLITAKEENAREVPEKLLEDFQIPNTNSISFINTTSARSHSARSYATHELDYYDGHIQQVIDSDTDVPLFIHFEHVQSNFAHLTIVLGTEVVPVQLRPLLAIYMGNFFSAPMQRGGKVIDFEQVLMDLERDTVGYDIGSGSRVGNSEILTIKLEVEVEKYQAAIQWFKNLMWDSIFDLERIKATTSRLLADIPEDKRDGSDMANSVELMVGTAPSSVSRACNTLVKATYLQRVKQILQKEPQVILDQLKSINAALCTQSNFRILVIADVLKLKNPVSSWEMLTADSERSKPLNALETRLSRLSEQGRNPGNVAFIIPMPPVESSFVTAVGKGPSSFDDPILPALMVATSYLNAVEGPLWTSVRGTGLAYGTTIYRHVDSGQVSLEIYRSPDPLKAFVATKEIVQTLAASDSKFNTFTLEGAISSIVLSFANAEENQASAAESSFTRQVLRGLPKDWPTLILEEVRKVTVEQIRGALKEVVLPMFEATTSNLFVTCAPIMQDRLVKGLEEIGFKPEVKPLVFFQDDYGLEVEGGVDGQSDEDDNMEEGDGEEGSEDDENDDDDDDDE